MLSKLDHLCVAAAFEIWNMLWMILLDELLYPNSNTIITCKMNFLLFLHITLIYVKSNNKYAITEGKHLGP